MFNKETNINTDSKLHRNLMSWYPTQSHVKTLLNEPLCEPNRSYHSSRSWMSKQRPDLFSFFCIVKYNVAFSHPKLRAPASLLSVHLEWLCCATQPMMNSLHISLCFALHAAQRRHWDFTEESVSDRRILSQKGALGVKNAAFKHITCMWGFYGEWLTWGILFRVAFVHAGWYLPVFR